MVSILTDPVQATEPLFHLLSEHTTVPLDQIRYVVLLFLGYPLGAIYRHSFNPDHTNVVHRHIVSTAMGLFFGLLCFGWIQMGVLFAMTGVCYAMLLVVPTNVVQIYTIVFAMASMSAAHTYRMIVDYGGWHLDFTGPLMLIVQRVTLTAFALHDGVARKEAELNEDQKKMKLNQVPSLLEYWSYNYNFHTFLAGPTCTMKEYLNFVDGSNFKVASVQNGDGKTKVKPSSLYPVLTTLLGSFICVVVYLILSPRYPLDSVLEPGYSLISRVLLTHTCLLTIRMRYYLVWLITEGVNDFIGLGFSGYDKDGKPEWEVCKNIRVFDVEFATNARMLITGWNVTTSLWLRRVCYERVPPKYWISSQSAAFLLSAIWHGFYPGYYVCFIFFRFINEAARKMRKLLHHHFQRNSVLKVFYDIITMVTTAFYVNHTVTCFQLLLLYKCVIFWSYFTCVPVVVVIVISLLPIPEGHHSKGKASD